MPRVSRPAAPGLAPEAGREARVAQRQVGLGEHLARVQRRQRDLARARQVERVVGQPVDLLLGVGQEARAEQRLLAHEHGRDHGLEPVLAEQLERPAHERELEQHEVALEVGEARARHARARLHVDQRAGELQVVARRTSSASPTSRSVVSSSAAVGSGGLGSDASAVSSSASIALELLAERLHATRDLLHLGDRGARVLAGLLGARDRPARPRSGARAAPSTSGRSSSWRASSARASSSRCVGPVAAARERGAHRVRVAADRLQVEHGSRPGASRRPAWARPGPSTWR